MRVPAASGNLGSGFDSAGLALALYNEAVADTELEGVHIEGEGADSLPADIRNYCVAAMHVLARRTGRELPAHGLHLTNRIPVSRGLASSGAAVLAGLMLANAMLDEPFSRSELVDLGTEIEAHPDNVAAAMLGGLVISVWDGERVHAVRLKPPPDLRAVLWVPEAALATKFARAALPSTVSLADAVFNSSHAALFAAAFASGQWEHLAVGAQDRLHQPYRAPLVPGLHEMMAAALHAGALSSSLSGAGPSVLALCKGDTEGVQQALEEVAAAYAGGGHVITLEPDLHGAEASRTEDA